MILGRSALGLVDAGADPRTAAALHERIGRYLWICGLQRDAIAELSRAVAVMPDDAPAAERARVLGAEGHLLTLLGRGAEARARCEQALELAREAGAAARGVPDRQQPRAALMMTGDSEAARDGVLERSRDLAEELGDPEELTRVLHQPRRGARSRPAGSGRPCEVSRDRRGDGAP